jgi:5-methylthioribose kinase
MVSELSADNAAEWLSRHHLPSANIRFAELGGGISNKVVLAEGAGFRAVMKQSLGQLRTEVGWHSDRERIFREAAAMRWIAGKSCVGGHIPRIVFEEPSSYTIAMEAAPSGAKMWKTQLFEGHADPTPARMAGVTLGSIVSASWHDQDAERLFGDQTIFTQLRIDPYYRFTAGNRPEAAEYIDDLIGRSAARRVSLVHGDWSPKNLLVHERGLWVIDWEVIHFGDPSFDVGFLLNHLLLKSIAMPRHRTAMATLAGEFLDGLVAELPPDSDWIVPAALEHLPALLLARVSGKSPAEYLDAAMRQRAAGLALDLMRHPAASADEVFSR